MHIPSNEICKLASNKVDYLIPGGERINRFLGEKADASVCSQMWIASLVTSALAPGTTVGLSRILGQEIFLRDCIAGNPDAWLGQIHAEHWGANLGFLLKLLNSRDRLLIQVHPDKAKAQKYFGLPCGKDEAWYVLEAGPAACIWLGFRPGVTKEHFRHLIELQDSEGMLSCLHRIPIKPGEAYYIPAGTVHAMGRDCLVAEIQEPIDITLRSEYIRPDGSRMSKESMYGNAGMDGLMDCFEFDNLPLEGVLKKYKVDMNALKEEPWRMQIISFHQTGCFYMDELRLDKASYSDIVCRNTSFRVLLVLEGTADFHWKGGMLHAKQGEELFVPNGVDEYRCVTSEKCRVLECGIHNIAD